MIRDKDLIINSC